ncbi:GAF domain-containing sensor histidine kinase [Myxococcus sp. AM009]|uniref:sensor histidine kinase n=1 Tax=unclassified Myxococcus TaxID=2648731 RepID=UPI0015951799|nr:MULTISPECIES: ATP-binding protein [unclassified Myxococcus]NVJ00201.1 GAF domain-containing sensor histidine kinase [Myxococcus sp. AM009]NVJ17720.1 GAF domain-containing sensor histidine kinase [Myxococcus sp. AM010]
MSRRPPPSSRPASVGEREPERPVSKEPEDVRLRGSDDAEERLAFLASAGELLSSSLDSGTVLQRLAELAVPLLADWCAVDVLTADGRVERVAAAHRLAEQVPLVHELARLQPLDLTAEGGIPEVLRTGKAALLPEVLDALLPGVVRTEAQLEVARRLGIRAGLIVPLLARGRVLGALSLVRGDADGVPGASDLALALELARRASLSLDNALLYAEARGAQQRTERLQAITAALSRAATAEDVAEALMREELRPTGPARGAVLGRLEDGRLRVLGSFGSAPSVLEAPRGPWADPVPGVDRALEPQWFSGHEAAVRAMPDWAWDLVQGVGTGAWAVLPLKVEHRLRGFLLFAWDGPRVFLPEERGFLSSLAQQCAQALERAALYEALRERGGKLHLALEAGKDAEARLFFLLEASRALAEHLDDVEWTLEHLARVVARNVASFCLVELAGADGVPRGVAAAHREPERDVSALASLLPARECFLSGETRFLPEVGPELRERIFQGPEHPALLEALSPHSLLSVAVRTRGRTLGVITLGAAAPCRRLVTADVAMAEELARRVAVALENASLYRDAQAAVRLRDEFLSVASHELKTPLTSLKLQHGLIDRAVSGDFGEKVRPRLATAVRQVQRLSALVDSLLDVSRISLGRLMLEPSDVDLGQAVRDAVERMEEVFTQAGCPVRVEVPGPLPGKWDSLRLDQVLVNLLTNAAKYGAGRPVLVEAAFEGEELVRVSVRDEGIGIAAEDLPRLFGRFERAVSDRHYGGLGLGLYISRQIVDAMGGSIEVESWPGQGSIFTVRLPRSTAQCAPW